ncbi:MAG: ATP-binding domain-containing protein [Mycoplasmoidaceae bacterium]|nr:ATP-binding domain-containing protein [Mycoplasmoidaceae bacterium]
MINLRKIIKDLTPSKSLIKIIEKISYREYLKTLDLEEKNENIDELINAITIFESEHENANIQSYLQEISLYTDTSEQKINNDNSVSLMTVHVAKGSEYKVIFLIGFSNGIFPPAKSTDFQEERRIAYVALTRAKQLLFITCSDGYSYSGGAMGPSIFLKEIGDKNLNQIKQEFKTISNADLD